MKYYQELQEGLYDPNIFKAFFLAGGPGSGKSYVVRKTTGGLGLKIVNSDDVFERLLDKEGLSKLMPPEELEPREVERAKSKKLTAARQTNYVEGRLGIIIDGTGKDFDKISGQARKLQGLGYDTYMIFVNTSIDTALERNVQRGESGGRTVPKALTIKLWKDVQSNMGKFSQLFRRNFIIVDNNNVDDDVFADVSKQIRSLLRIKVSNTRAKNWMAMELAKKKRI